jgi:hypothetical protein
MIGIRLDLPKHALRVLRELGCADVDIWKTPTPALSRRGFFASPTITASIFLSAEGAREEAGADLDRKTRRIENQWP